MQQEEYGRYTVIIFSHLLVLYLYSRESLKPRI